MASKDFELVLQAPDAPAGRRRRQRAERPAPTGDLWHYETQARSQGRACVAGVDEAGRGPLAGPVVAACVVLSPDFPLDGIDDSKKLTEHQREASYDRIRGGALAVGVGMAEPDEIDRINILQATWAAMRRAILALTPAVMPDLLLVDGLAVPNLPCPNVLPIVGGDAASASIAAASIVAKVTRDRMMVGFDADYPGYGFASHKGYGCATHLSALRSLGPCPIHRRSFSPVADCLNTLFDEP